MAFFEELILRYPAMISVQKQMQKAYILLHDSFLAGNTIYLCGNGGSASDCEHIAGELMKSFRLPRPLSTHEKDVLTALGPEGVDLAEHLQKALPAVPLVSQCALTSAIANDIGGDYVFAQQIYGYGKPGDVLLCISTSGNSKNVLLAAAAAKAIGVSVLSLSGRDGGKLKALSDVCITCPTDKTEEIQEYHLPIYHALCAMLEEYFWGKN